MFLRHGPRFHRKTLRIEPRNFFLSTSTPNDAKLRESYSPRTLVVARTWSDLAALKFGLDTDCKSMVVAFAGTHMVSYITTLSGPETLLSFLTRLRVCPGAALPYPSGWSTSNARSKDADLGTTAAMESSRDVMWAAMFLPSNGPMPILASWAGRALLD